MRRNIFTAAVAIIYLICSVCPAFAYSETPDLNIISDTYVVIDAASGQVLIQKNMDKQKFPASITKILTVALGLENGNLSDTITMDKKTVFEIAKWGNSTHIALNTGEVLSLKDAIYATFLESANDAANAVALSVSGDIEQFPALMNEKVAELGLSGTHFTNAHGLPDDNHYTTAYDMAMITRYALSVEGVREVFTSKTYTMQPTNQNTTRYFGTYHLMCVNSQYTYQGAIGGKLGWTTESNHTIVTLAQKNGLELICVCLDSYNKYDKFKDTAALLDYCFENYKTFTMPQSYQSNFSVPIYENGDSLGTVRISPASAISFTAANDAEIMDYRLTYNIPESYENGMEISPACSVITQSGDVIASAQMNYEIIPIEELSVQGETHESLTERLRTKILRILKWGAMIGGALTIVLLSVRFFVRSYYKNKRKKALSKKQ